MANVMFKRGTQSALETLMRNKTFAEGTFYLTTDSDRLYFAQAADELVLLNHQVIHVSTLNDLPEIAKATIGDFYYVVSENILCTKSATSSSWVQINKNTNDNDDTKTTGLTFTKSVDTSSGNITLNYTLKQLTSHINGEATPVDDITGSFVIKGSEIALVITPASVGVTSTMFDGTVSISTTGDGANTNKKVNITGSGSVLVSATTDNITIAGTDTKYDLESAPESTAITLKDKSDNSVDSVTITSGNQISVSGLNENEINVAHAEIQTTKTENSSSISSGATFTAITSINTDNGHISGYTESLYTIPKASKYSIASINADSNGKINVGLKDEVNNSIATASSGTDLYYIVNNTPVYNQGSIEFYTKEEIDTKINGIDAMVYRGTVGDLSRPSLPTTDVHNGDTYKAVAKSSFGGHECDIGDLLIATGTEGPNGTIVGDIVWTYVPSGDDVDTTYKLKTANNVISLYNNATLKDDGAVTLVAGTDAVVNTSGSSITIGHASKNPTITDTVKKTLTAKSTFTAITGITDSNGHLATITPTEFTLPDDTNTTYKLGTDSTNGTPVITLTGSDNKITSANINSGTNISVSGTLAGITINHATPQGMSADTTGSKIELQDGGGFSAITSITRDPLGHVTNYKLSEIKLPALKTYSIANTFNEINGVHSVITTLTRSDGLISSSSTFSLTSNSLAINRSETTLSVDLLWGTF